MLSFSFRSALIAGFALLGAEVTAAPLVRFQVVGATATDLGTLGGSNIHHSCQQRIHLPR